MIWVLDASVAIRWFIEEETNEHADEILREIVNNPENFAVPELFAFEVYAVLLRIHPNGIGTFRNGIIPILQSGIFRRNCSSFVNRRQFFSLFIVRLCET